jgi:acyl-CoA thioester hydrolase
MHKTKGNTQERHSANVLFCSEKSKKILFFSQLIVPLQQEHQRKRLDMKYIFETEMEVRDYECDIEGIVNNANYLHYAEHTRHLFLRSLGVSFAKIHEQGTDAVVARMNLKFKTPLRCDDTFVSKLGLSKEGIKYVFHQDIFRKADNRLCFHGDIELVCIVNGRLSGSPEYDAVFAPFVGDE